MRLSYKYSTSRDTKPANVAAWRALILLLKRCSAVRPAAGQRQAASQPAVSCVLSSAVVTRLARKVLGLQSWLIAASEREAATGLLKFRPHKSRFVYVTGLRGLLFIQTRAYAKALARGTLKGPVLDTVYGIVGEPQ